MTGIFQKLNFAGQAALHIESFLPAMAGEHRLPAMFLRAGDLIDPAMVPRSSSV